MFCSTRILRYQECMIGKRGKRRHSNKKDLLNSTRIKGAGVTRVLKFSEVNSMTSSGASLGLTPASARIDEAKASRVDMSLNDFMIEGEECGGVIQSWRREADGIDCMLSRWPLVGEWVGRSRGYTGFYSGVSAAVRLRGTTVLRSEALVWLA